jgi:hypothetical protein
MNTATSESPRQLKRVPTTSIPRSLKQNYAGAPSICTSLSTPKRTQIIQNHKLKARRQIFIIQN